MAKESQKPTEQEIREINYLMMQKEEPVEQWFPGFGKVTFDKRIDGPTRTKLHHILYGNPGELPEEAQDHYQDRL